jgi:hypothetical protein
MNIQNISVLSHSLQDLGFENGITYQLLKNASFKAANFTIHQRIIRANDVLNFYLTFEKNGNVNTYSCPHYDATLRKEIEIPNLNINQIEVKELDKRMADINWTNVFSLSANKKLQFEDKATWAEEEKIENIVTDLLALESIEEGKEISDRLKIKYWCDIPGHEIICNLGSLRSKFEINQRFYFFEGQSGICVEEAYRFLHNRWIEKQVQARKRQIDVTKVEEPSSNNAKASSDKGLLQKKKRNKNTKAKNLASSVQNIIE